MNLNSLHDLHDLQLCGPRSKVYILQTFCRASSLYSGFWNTCNVKKGDQAY